MSELQVLQPAHAASIPPGFDLHLWTLISSHAMRTRLRAGMNLRVCDRGDPSHVLFPIDALLSFVSPRSGIEILSLGSGGMSVPDLMLGPDALALDTIVTIEGDAWSIETHALRRLATEQAPLREAMLAQCRVALQQATRHADQRAKSLQVANLARWLCRAVTLTGKTNFGVTHATLGRLLGTRRTAVTEGLAYLADRRFLSVGHRLITIVDPDGLARQGSVCRGGHALH